MESTEERWLPGHPRIALDDRREVLDFVARDLCPLELDEMAPYLWWMAKPESSSISSLHQHRLKGRTIVVAEDPKLHLTWIGDKVYIKPLPAYITSYHFWTRYFDGSQDEVPETMDASRRIRRSALGLLRSYFHLIQHESDFKIAQEPGISVLPEHITWKGFCRFSSGFGHILDSEVSARYRYGELRLARLNFYAPILLRKAQYYRTHREYGKYFEELCRPWFFVFGFMTVVLGGLQVAIAVEQIAHGTVEEKALQAQSWIRASLVLSVLMVVCVFMFVACLAILYVSKIANEWQYAVRERFHRRKSGYQS
ncbi:hypothetical protein BU26DRAFT_430657 [Trematosphaeria pertusa]|uniref:Subtilisin-like serine protease n=1 Tax=Trematosphaeria pertusa TaxID=390896 RepID=A0A6A6IA62_9PLEO|nr:uncharacterized protein BU26DRAFT_430657 [Trematosphaeria pertusa]KAF2246948.1 hypothetical protein BU26DRAFT_430657 [Trematosphaeria pertusa]